MAKVLTWEDLRSAINLNTGFFETSQYELDAQMRIVAGNWDGAGMSAGNLQYNFGAADRLSELFNFLLTNHEAVVRNAFGVREDLFDEFKTVNLTYTRTAKITWANGITDWTEPAPDGHALVDPWNYIIGDLMVMPECKAKYFQMMDTYYIPDALDLFKQLSCTSRAALASLFDLNINRGRFYPCNTLQRDFELIEANLNLTEFEKEAQKIFQINKRGNDTTNGMDTSAAAFAPRRDCQANQGGTYFGSLYDPETMFNITQDPAIPEKAAGFPGEVRIGEIHVENIFLGENPIKNIYLGVDLLGSAEIEPYLSLKAPDSQFRTNSNSYLGFEGGTITLEKGKKLWIDIQNFVACLTYYTTDGTTPTENSPRYHEFLTFDKSCTLKVLNVSLSGVAEPIKTLTINVPAFTGWRYVRFVGHGDQTGVTTRLVEIQALEGATNRLLNLLPLAGYTTPSAGTIGVATNGAKLHATGYPLWWIGEGIPDLKYDLGANYKIDTINVTGFSPVTDPRTTQFKIYVSTDNLNWIPVADYSANTTNQPESGFNFPVPQSL
jgi:Chitobiase/beta-hexosaminidase C-terminal domain/F5/8 type C domain